MKRLFALILVLGLLVGGGVAIAYDDPGNGIKKHAVGVPQGVATKVYQLVRFADRGDDTASLSSGDVVVWDTVSDDGITVRTTTTSADGAIAGILVATLQTADAASTSASDDAGRRNWAYMQVYGPATANATAAGTNAAAVGEVFITSDDAGAISTATNDSDNLFGRGGGFFLDAGDASATEYDVFVRLE